MENREIKFRAWDTNLKEPVMYDDWQVLWGDEAAGLILMQYTGLKDKNGKEIYQGDLLKVTADPDGYGSTSYEGIIEVTAETCGYSLKPIKPTFEELEDSGKPWDSSSMWHVCEKNSVTGEGTTEIIGNIWESPELLTNNK